MRDDLLVYGGRVWTGDKERPWAESLLTKNGRFHAVGDKAYVESMADKSAIERIDARGALVIPGITDAHMHLTEYCKGRVYLDLSDVTSIDALLERIKIFIETHREDHWIRAINYNETLWGESISPTMEMLDSVSGGRAVLVSRYCGHVHVANKMAMIESGIWESSDNNIVRKDDGEPSGTLHEGAALPILLRIKEAYESPEKVCELVASGCKGLASMGITAVHACDVSAYGITEDVSIFQRLHDQGRLPLRVVTYHDRLPNLSFRSGLGDERVVYGGFKVFIDGNLGGHTSAMREPFADKPSSSGQLIHTDGELFALLHEAQSRDIQVQIHMIGDSAIDQAIRVCYKLLEEFRKKPRLPWRFNHVIVCRQDQLELMRHLGVVLDVQPIQAYTDRNMAPDRLGRERMEWAYSFRRLYDSGLIMTGSSDCPMENPNPWLGVWASMCRCDLDGAPLKWAKQDERLTLEEALAIYTKNPYRAIGWEAGYGSIREGNRADFVLLEGDPFTQGEQAIKDTTVRGTFVDGIKTY